MNGNLKVVNEIITNDVTLSTKAKGILSFMVCFPDDELFSVKSLISNFSDGRESIRSGLNELELKGYVETKQERDELGKFIRSDWIVVNEKKEEKMSYEEMWFLLKENLLIDANDLSDEDDEYGYGNEMAKSYIVFMSQLEIENRKNKR